MKALFFLMGFGLVCFSCGCSSKDSVPGEIPKDNLVLSGSFVDFWSKGDWTQRQWEDQLQEMKDIGLTTVIIQFTSYGEYTWFDSDNTFTATKFPHALERLLAAATQKKMDVYIGLYFDDGYWENQTNVSWLQLHADRCNEIATEIQAQFGNNPAFKGWYIPHEPEPHAYSSTTLVSLFRDNLVNRISDSLHKLNDKPVAIAAFFNSQLTTTNQLSTFMTQLSKGNLQVIMLQDGVGVDHVSLNELSSYFLSANEGLFGNSSDYTGAFWSDLETFQNAGAPSATIDRIKIQLEAASGAPDLSKIVSFQYFTDMSPGGPNTEAASKLRSDYINYLNSLK